MNLFCSFFGHKIQNSALWGLLYSVSEFGWLCIQQLYFTYLFIRPLLVSNRIWNTVLDFLLPSNSAEKTKALPGPQKEQSSWLSSLVPWGGWFITNCCREALFCTHRKECKKKSSSCRSFPTPSCMLDKNSIGPLGTSCTNSTYNK